MFRSKRTSRLRLLERASSKVQKAFKNPLGKIFNDIQIFNANNTQMKSTFPGVQEPGTRTNSSRILFSLS